MICLLSPDSKDTKTRKAAFTVFFWLERRQKTSNINNHHFANLTESHKCF